MLVGLLFDRYRFNSFWRWYNGVAAWYFTLYAFLSDYHDIKVVLQWRT